MVIWILSFMMWLACGNQPPHADSELVILVDEPVDASVAEGHYFKGDPLLGRDGSERTEAYAFSESCNEDDAALGSDNHHFGAEISLESGREQMPDFRPEDIIDESRVCDEALCSDVASSRPEGESDHHEISERPALSNWIGEACSRDADCDYAGGYCLRAADGYADGHCTLSCTSTCPDLPNKPITFCIENSAGQGYCVSQCQQIPCRKGYDCQWRQRINQTSKTAPVCVPELSSGYTNMFLMIGDSQSSGSKFAQVMVNFLREPQKTCASAKTMANVVYSYAKVSSAARHWSAVSGTNKDWMCNGNTIYTNGTAAQNTSGQQLCSDIINTSSSLFQKLIALHKANAFLIQLGANSIGFSESYVKSRVIDMLDQMPAGSLCFWVAPVYGTTYTSQKKSIETWLREVLVSYNRVTCELLTSFDEMSVQTTCTPFNTSDGLHLTNCGSQLWGELIRSKICNIKRL